MIGSAVFVKGLIGPATGGVAVAKSKRANANPRNRPPGKMDRQPFPKKKKVRQPPSKNLQNSKKASVKLLKRTTKVQGKPRLARSIEK